MAIRKYGSTQQGDGEVTSVEQDGISKQAAQDWTPGDDDALAAENQPDVVFGREPLDDV